MIFEETIELLKSKYIDLIKEITIQDVRFGVYMSGVKLSDNSYGFASTLPNFHGHCNKENRDFGDFSPNKILNSTVYDLLNCEKKNGLLQTLKISVINALSSQLIDSKRFTVLEDKDPIDLIDLSKQQTITIVGAFHSYIEKIAGTSNRLYVSELNKEVLLPDEMKYYIPANEAYKVFPVSDVVIITGLTFINETFDEILENLNPKSKIIITGPSSSFIPDILFQKSIDIVGSVKITKPELMMQIIGEGATGYHFFRYCAKKICIINDKN